jgi:hypothetical protein
LGPCVNKSNTPAGTREFDYSAVNHGSTGCQDPGQHCSITL